MTTTEQNANPRLGDYVEIDRFEFVSPGRVRSVRERKQIRRFVKPDRIEWLAEVDGKDKKFSLIFGEQQDFIRVEEVEQ